MKRVLIPIGLATIIWLTSGCNGVGVPAADTEQPAPPPPTPGPVQPAPDQPTESEQPVLPPDESPSPQAMEYVIVDTGQDQCYDGSREISCPQPGEPFYGQDAQYQGNQPLIY